MYKPLVEQVIGKREDSNTTGLYDHQPPPSSSGVHSYDPAPQPPQKRDEE